ncbi:MAG: LiaI-LiaF-like domain-containing protein [Thermoleophilia bacterium]
MTTGRVIPGAVLIVLGALFLGANFGYVDWGFVASLWQLWPLILIMVGVQLFLGSRRQWPAALLMLIILAGGVALVLLGEERAPWFYGAGLTTTTIAGPASAGVQGAEARIDVGAARIDIGSRPGSALATGTFESRGDPRVTHNVSNGTYALEVQQEKGVRIFPINVGGDRLIRSMSNSSDARKGEERGRRRERRGGRPTYRWKVPPAAFMSA